MDVEFPVGVWNVFRFKSFCVPDSMKEFFFCFWLALSVEVFFLCLFEWVHNSQ